MTVKHKMTIALSCDVCSSAAQSLLHRKEHVQTIWPHLSSAAMPTK